MWYSYGVGPSMLPVCARPKDRHYSEHWYYSAHFSVSPKSLRPHRVVDTSLGEGIRTDTEDRSTGVVG